jgi:hypothetical protein
MGAMEVFCSEWCTIHRVASRPSHAPAWRRQAARRERLNAHRATADDAAAKVTGGGGEAADPNVSIARSAVAPKSHLNNPLGRHLQVTRALGAAAKPENPKP